VCETNASPGKDEHVLGEAYQGQLRMHLLLKSSSIFERAFANLSPFPDQPDQNGSPPNRTLWKTQMEQGEVWGKGNEIVLF